MNQKKEREKLKITYPCNRWREDLLQRDGLTPITAHFLDVLEGKDIPNENINEQAAVHLLKLRTGSFKPSDLWICFFRILNALLTFEKYANAPIEKLAVNTWRFAVTHQTFAFIAPTINCLAIENLCYSNSLSGFVRVAAILEAAAVPLRINLSQSGRDMLNNIQKNKPIQNKRV